VPDAAIEVAPEATGTTLSKINFEFGCITFARNDLEVQFRLTGSRLFPMEGFLKWPSYYD
jgi:hypothetical protein